MVALGLAGTLAGLPQPRWKTALRASWKRSAEALAPTWRRCSRAWRWRWPSLDPRPAPAGPPAPAGARPRWLLSGNEAAGCGALRGGVRFVAAYPITPATELLEWMAPALRKVGGSLLQAEDELASINMIIGASYGGVPSLTATAGPGLALMTEGIGLAVAAEVPVVVVDVMRGGPSTGIPAKSEQSDLSFAVRPARRRAAPGAGAQRRSRLPGHDRSGRCSWPRRCRRPRCCCPTSSWASRAPSSTSPRRPPCRRSGWWPRPNTPTTSATADTPSGVSPMAIPGTPGTAYTADGLEHTERGIPSSQARDHVKQLTSASAS
jgi:2-oxoglutarate ferredoxin oxidoreductase subunit alpha